MRIFMACPAPANSRKGNRVTAARWARILKQLGHQVEIDRRYDFRPCDLLVALHARKSVESVQRYRLGNPNAPLIVALTGTDLYRDIRTNWRAKYALELADRLIVLQPRGVDELPSRMHPKTRVIYQSVEPIADAPAQSEKTFDVCVLGHLRAEKDPLRTALALRLLPGT